MVTTSRGAVLRAFNQPLTIEEAEVPAPEPGALVARVSYGGVCGTDVHLHHGNLPIPTPVILGPRGGRHRLEAGGGRRAPISPANRCAKATRSPGGPTSPAGGATGAWSRRSARSAPTARSTASTSASTSGRGSPAAGRTTSICNRGRPSSASRTDISPEQAIALGCAGPTTVHGVLERCPVGVGETVVVQGSGPVGMAAAMYAHLSGAAQVILVGGPAGRLGLARELGVGDVHIDLFEVADPAERIRLVLDETPGKRGADVVLECAGVPAAVAEGFEMARRNGRYLVLGQYTDRGETPINPHVDHA